jgi:hypothetical protein
VPGSSAAAGNLASSASTTRANWAPTWSASGWSTTAQQRQHPRLGALGLLGRQVAGVVVAAALPARAGQGRADSLDQTGVAAGSDQPDAGNAAGEEGRAGTPASRRASWPLATSRPSTSRWPSALTRTANSAWTRTVRGELADLERQGVQPHERVRAGVRAAGLRNAATCASRLLAISLTCDLDSRVTPSVSTSLLHPPGGHAQQVAGRHDRDQRLPGAAAFPQPVRDLVRHLVGHCDLCDLEGSPVIGPEVPPGEGRPWSAWAWEESPHGRSVTGHDHRVGQAASRPARWWPGRRRHQRQTARHQGSHNAPTTS